MMTRLDSVERAVADIAEGKAVVVIDVEDRENEGVLIFAAEKATPELVAFMVRYTSGYLCVPLDGAICDKLGLLPMYAVNQDKHGTAYTVTVDAKEGVGTGISASDRATTMRMLADPDSVADDFTRPGHVVPLRAKDGGVRRRPGHTDAAVDLARLAGLQPAGAICEIVSQKDEGAMAQTDELRVFADEHDLALISIADLIAYRQARDKLVKRIGEFPVQSKIGTLAGYAYVTPFDAIQHMAFVYGRIGDGRDMLARLHRADIIRDVFGGANPIHASLQRFKQDGRGVIVFLRDGAAGVPTQPIPQPGSTGSEVARSRQWREVGLGAQILKDLGITSIRLLTSAKLTYVGLAGFGIEIVSTEMIDDRSPRD